MKPSINEKLGFLLALTFLISCQSGVAGTWTNLVRLAPVSGQNALGPMLLLSDGTAMVQNSGNGWARLTPDNHGSYINGTWSTNAPMQFSRTWYSSAVLQDGRVFVAGAEYGTGTTNGEVYNPLNDAWIYIPVPPGLITTNNNPPPSTLANNAGFRDSVSVILANGTVLISPVIPATNGGTVIFDPVSNTLLAGAVLTNGDTAVGEASWVKLRDDSILTINGSQQSQRYIPSLNQWTPDANLPVQIMDSFGGEFGAALLLPDGRAFFLGGGSNTALYTPSGNLSPGTWTAGPPIPNGQGVPDGPAAMMANGRILCAVSPAPFGFASSNIYTSPVSFYEYDYTVGPTGAFFQVIGPTGTTNMPGFTFTCTMLALPDGNILFCNGGNQLYVYQPGGLPLPAGKPTISTINANADGSFHLTGTMFNGLSQGASYGDDAQMDSNYPLVRMTNNSNGNVLYSRTFNWSSTSVQTGGSLVSTEFTVPPAVFANGGSHSLVVVAQGIPSNPITFPQPVWVDFNYVGVTQNGSYNFPYKTLTNAVTAVSSGGTIFCKGPASHRETPRITKAMRIIAYGGPVTVGR